jgi:NAD-dependent SIR2 family protein deacetylase
MEFDQEALIRSIAISHPAKYMLLLGAGASASSGIPTAGQCIWEWKRDIYLSGNHHLSPNFFLDVSLPAVQQKIQRWLDQQGKFPLAGDQNEYGFFIEHAYPKSNDRREYFERRFSGAIPQVGYQLLAMLQNSLLFQWIWTTDFDGLARQARKPHHTRPLKEIGLDTSFRFQDIREGDECGYLVYLHGDYRYDPLQNTTKETKALDEGLRLRFIEQVRSQALIVIGYGGRRRQFRRRRTEENFIGVFFEMKKFRQRSKHL